MKTIREAAPLMGLTTRGLYERIVRRKLPGAVKQGREWMIPDDVVEPYIGSLTVTAAANFVSKHGGPRSKQTIYNYITEGRINAFEDYLGITRVYQSELEELLGLEERERVKRAQRELQPEL